MAKNFKLKASEIIDLVPAMGGCMATDKLTVEGMKVGYMYREEPDSEFDSGWRFFRAMKPRNISMILIIQ
jgi:hypothetical protein